ncbi:unnamed protein product [Calypogeia fissa]
MAARGALLVRCGARLSNKLHSTPASTSANSPSASSSSCSASSSSGVTVKYKRTGEVADVEEFLRASGKGVDEHAGTMAKESGSLRFRGGSLKGLGIPCQQDASFDGFFSDLAFARQLKHWYQTSAVVSPLCTPVEGTEKEKRVRVQLRVLRKTDHGLNGGLIPQSTWRVLDNLHRAGYEAYLVGGSVRDLLLKQVPKDFDVLSTADPGEVKRTFPGRCFIVGKRFPICHVHSHGQTIEVSSFSTNLRNKKQDRGKSGERVPKDAIIDGTEGWDDRDFARWENSLKRDFTINGLMYDPFKCVLYDYVGGLRDLRKLKVRTVIPADESFTEDSARILRAIRIGARLGFKFTKSTAEAIKDQRFSLLKLNKGRLMLEANMFFSYGSAEPSLRLLWRYGVLELLLPLQAGYFVSQEFKRRDTGSNFLLDLLRNLDKVVAPDRPCHGSLWVALLAFHLAVTDRNSSPVVAATAALTMDYLGNKQKAAAKAKRVHMKFGSRYLKAEDCDETSVEEEQLIEEAELLLEHSKSFLNKMMDSEETAQVMQALTGVESEDKVAVGQAYSQRAYALFRTGTRTDNVDSAVLNGGIGREKKDKKVLFDPEAVTQGDTNAVCYVFSRIVLNTLYPRPPIGMK